MVTRRFVATALAALMAAGTISLLAAQANGTLGGNAADEAKKPYTDYTVQLRDPSTGQIAATVPLDTYGRFTFANVEFTHALLVELYNTKLQKVVCTEGPFTLSATTPIKNDVNIDCGSKKPVAFWLLAAGAGTAAAIAAATASPSQ